MKQITTYVGTDAHKKDLFIAVGSAAAPVELDGAERAEYCGASGELERDAPGPARVFYEAGPCGTRCSVK